MLHRADAQHGVVLEVVKQDVAFRLRRVCESLSESDFQELVARIAEVEVRYRLRDQWSAQAEALWPSESRAHATDAVPRDRRTYR